MAKLSPEDLVKHHEDCNEFGGYFILNGLEKLIRMLVIPTVIVTVISIVTVIVNMFSVMLVLLL